MPQHRLHLHDPVIWAEYAIDTAKIARAEGIKTVAVTAGYITDLARPEFYEHIDAANVDLKAFTEEFYRSQTLSHLQPVLDTLEWLKKESSVWFEITNLMIPGENDSLMRPPASAIGSRNISARTCPSISPPSTRTSRCETRSTLLSRRSSAPARSPGPRTEPCLSGQRPRRGPPEHRLPRMRHRRHRARPLRNRGLPHPRRSLRELRHIHPRGFENTCGSWGRKRQPVDLRRLSGLR